MKRTVMAAPVKKDWKMLRLSLPEDWKQLATDMGALSGLCKCPDVLLRTLLIRLGCRHSLREIIDCTGLSAKIGRAIGCSAAQAFAKISGLAVRTL